MKRNRLIMAALGAAVATAVVAAPAHAYFSATTQSLGGVQIHVKPDTTITEEDVVNGRKVVTITNLSTSTAPVMVRARYFAPNDVTVTAELEGSGWSDGGDGYFYYDKVLPVGESANPFVLNVVDITASEAIADPDDPTKIDMDRIGDNFNVIVVYEATNVIDYSGSAPVGTFGRNGS